MEIPPNKPPIMLTNSKVVEGEPKGRIVDIFSRRIPPFSEFDQKAMRYQNRPTENNPHKKLRKAFI
jgi:hypothetical protein